MGRAVVGAGAVLVGRLDICVVGVGFDVVRVWVGLGVGAWVVVGACVGRAVAVPVGATLVDCAVGAADVDEAEGFDDEEDADDDFDDEDELELELELEDRGDDFDGLAEVLDATDAGTCESPPL